MKSKLDVAKKMPPLRHSVPGLNFDIAQSEVVGWLIKQPEIMQEIFDIARNRKVIIYNPETQKWQGVDYHDD